MILYRVDHMNATVVAVECEKPSYPNHDADGEKIYVNTHYADEGEAWARLVSNAEAGVSLGATHRKDVRAMLERATARLADDAERLAKAKAGAEAYAERAKERRGSS